MQRLIGQFTMGSIHGAFGSSVVAAGHQDCPRAAYAARIRHLLATPRAANARERPRTYVRVKHTHFGPSIRKGGIKT